ncbi:MAG: LamG domain-containing protein [Deltaproteobacteria bacterium]|nr:LamG domain-containing protein [Deltaproteobacteria bacterium]
MSAADACAGAALRLDGIDDIVTVPAASVAGLTTFSIAFSLRADGAGGGGLPRILTKEDGPGGSDVVVHYRAAEGAIAINMFNTAGTLFATFASGVVQGQRANWVVVYDDAGDRRIHVYKNGAETSYTRQDPLAGTLRATTNPWNIGNQAGRVRGLDGVLDEVRIYDAAVSRRTARQRAPRYSHYRPCPARSPPSAPAFVPTPSGSTKTSATATACCPTPSWRSTDAASLRRACTSRSRSSSARRSCRTRRPPLAARSRSAGAPACSASSCHARASSAPPRPRGR